MQKEIVKAEGLQVHKEELRFRSKIHLERFSSTKTRMSNKFRHHASTAINTPQVSPPKVAEQQQNNNKIKVNWIKYNILIGIYENWLRLEPFVSYWLSKHQQADNCQDSQIVKKEYLKRAVIVRNINEQAIKRFSQLLKENHLFNIVRNRKAKLLEVIKEAEDIQIQEDLQNLASIKMMANKLMSTLPIENKKWTKARLQKQNRMLEDMIKELNDDSFKLNGVNGAFILQSIRDRINFINKVQQKFKFYHNSQKEALLKKLQMLQKPMNSIYCLQTLKKEYESNYMGLWDSMNEQSNQPIKKPYLKSRTGLRYKKYIKKDHNPQQISKSNSNENISIKHDAMNRSKLRFSIKKNNNSKENIQLTSRMSIKSIDSENDNTKVPSQDNTQENSVLNDYFKRFMPKLLTRDQRNAKTKTLLKTTFNDEQTRKDNKFRSSISSQISFVGMSTHLIKDTIKQISEHQIEEIKELTKEDRYNSYKSNKKITTHKNITINNNKIKISKVIIKKHSNTSTPKENLQYQSQIREKIKKKKEPLYGRGGRLQGAFHKSTHDQTFDVEGLFDHSDSLKTRQEYVNQFKLILKKGFLDGQIYEKLKAQVSNLITKCSPAKLAENHEIVKKIINKNLLQNENISLFSHLSLGQSQRELILQELHDMIAKDERIRHKIREEFKIFSQDQFYFKSQSQNNVNQQFILHANQNRHLNEQLKRMIAFKNEEKQIKLGHKLVRMSNQLQQQAY